MKRSSGAAQVPLGDAEGYGSLGAHSLATSRAPGTERRRGAEGDLAGRGVLCYVKAACLKLGHARSRAQAVDGAYRLPRSQRIAFNALVSPPWSFGGEEHLPLEVPSRGPGREAQMRVVTLTGTWTGISKAFVLQGSMRFSCTS